MGIETVLLIVNEKSLDEILDTPWNDVYQLMSRAKLRHLRPAKLPRLNRAFDIDCEAEILDWMETVGSMDGSVRDVLLEIENGEEGLLQFMQFASPGNWECWEARSYLYLDVALDREIIDRNDLYSMATWDTLVDRLANLPEEEFADKVCMDWMDRRKQLGETLDEKEDPKIIPTYEAHSRNSKLLVYAVTEWQTGTDNIGIVGREHLEASQWGHGEVNLRNYLRR
ncbi:MAG TPA: hypothetical protein HA354_02995 [Candidatus Poseidoniaceae archaeon]|nr:MAG TPA: hypothetical protein D7I07_02970 [Candidatus Poseidoniales archaeon]HII37446.1 hypothetical protein [Candidatus Poseidoniaceae archaeon]|tara:strand:+ start:492 stop:1169 length:678 start_codon:yes stop_codon:yes gene_type:complete